MVRPSLLLLLVATATLLIASVRGDDEALIDIFTPSGAEALARGADALLGHSLVLDALVGDDNHVDAVERADIARARKLVTCGHVHARAGASCRCRDPTHRLVQRVPPTTNGCGDGAFKPRKTMDGYELSWDLESVCNRHDLCYGTAFTNFRQCNERFCSALPRRCATNTAAGSASRRRCTTVAHFLCQMVSGHIGWHFYKLDQFDSLTCLAPGDTLDTVHALTPSTSQQKKAKAKSKAKSKAKKTSSSSSPSWSKKPATATKKNKAAAAENKSAKKSAKQSAKQAKKTAKKTAKQTTTTTTDARPLLPRVSTINSLVVSTERERAHAPTDVRNAFEHEFARFEHEDMQQHAQSHDAHSLDVDGHRLLVEHAPPPPRSSSSHVAPPHRVVVAAAQLDFNYAQLQPSAVSLDDGDANDDADHALDNDVDAFSF